MLSVIVNFDNVLVFVSFSNSRLYSLCASLKVDISTSSCQMKQIDSNNSFQKLHQRQEFRKKFPMAIIVYALTVIQCLANLIFPKSPNFNIVVGIFFFTQILLYVFVGHRTEQNRTATIITNRKRRSFLDLNISINILQLLHLI